MNVQQPQREQDSDREPAPHDSGGPGGTGTAGAEVLQALTAPPLQRALTVDLMEQVCSPKNLLRAYRRVRANKGAPGVDGMFVHPLADWLREHQEALIAWLRAGTCQPQPVRGVEIPKPGGRKRQLGIPAVVDGLVQQAILQVLEPLLDPTFSESSFGFRPKRSAHHALRQARKYVSEGRHIVVDLDPEKFFDRVNHDILMSRLARRIGDKRLLRIVRRFLQADLIEDGVCVAREQGTPQGAVLTAWTQKITWAGLGRRWLLRFLRRPRHPTRIGSGSRYPNRVSDGDRFPTHEDLFHQQSQDLLLLGRVQRVCPRPQPCAEIGERLDQPQILGWIAGRRFQRLQFGLNGLVLPAKLWHSAAQLVRTHQAFCSCRCFSGSTFLAASSRRFNSS